MRGTRWLATAVVLSVAVFGLAACGGGGDDDNSANTGVVKATRFNRYDPDEITARLNARRVFTFQNDTDADHNITITHIFTDPDNFLSVDVKAGENGVVEFTVKERPRDGFLSFYCRFHQAQGMQGKIRLT